ncbi:hypothetical protein NM208_g13941 [Fusarium decemcellulare]|uniref:Uncharacterized protein n=1 Tax=Fusarium decemcellulare TaxID=57161 RepID=A0ACC1RJT3_9HYPO|nr:hypothetical protein NM208_g13941 [Fusarium decemcellulare]
MNLCEKPAPSMGTTMIILIIAGAVALLCFLVFLYMLHRRRQRLDKLEDAKDLQELDDYGIKSMPKQQKTPPPAMPQAPPPTYERSQDRSRTDDNNWKRDSTDSLTPSLRQAMGVVPRDTLANNQKVLPLDGVTVVSLEHAIAAPFCTRQLADLGARVIKVERPGEGDFARNYDTRVRGLASHFVWTNRSKESLALDVKNPRDFKVLKTLLAKADVLVQNLAPGASQRLGLSFDALKDENPGLIVCDISGYGSNGPYRDKKAYDLLVQSEAGLVSVTGTEAEPASHAEWMSFPLYYAFDGAPGPKRAGASHAAIYPYGPFDTANGGTVMMGLQNEREWAKLCTDVLEKPELAKDERFITNSLRSQNRKALREIICAVFSSLSPEAVLEKLDKAGIANAKVNDMQASGTTRS